METKRLLLICIGVSLLRAAAVFAQTSSDATCIISDKLHHIGDGNYLNSHSADRMKALGVKNEGATFRGEFFILEGAVSDVTLTLDELYGHDGGPPVQVLINLQLAGTITDNGSKLSIPIPADLLKLGKKNIIQIVSPSGDGDVDDLEFENIRLLYKKAPAPQIRFVRFREGLYEPASVLRHGDEFHVEAHFKSAPSEPPGKIQLTGMVGGTLELVVEPTGEDPKVFRSVKRMRLDPP